MNFPLTLDSKRKIILPNGIEIVDLTHQTLKYKAEDVMIINSVYCSSSMKMRADFIASLVYNDPSRTEYILKFNNISNPFSLDEGDPVMIPDSLNAREKFQKKNKYEEIRENIRKQFLDESKITAKDPNLTEFEKRQIVNLPPNYAKDGDKEIVVENGKIKFGPNISRNQKSTDLNDNKKTTEQLNFLKKIKELKK